MFKITLLILLSSYSLQSLAEGSLGNPEAGQKKAGLCIACHGAQGISPQELWPNLKGQKQSYLIKQMQAFKSGLRVDPIMQPLMQSLTEEDFQDISAYFSQLK